jgi:hypothetical protein
MRDMVGADMSERKAAKVVGERFGISVSTAKRLFKAEATLWLEYSAGLQENPKTTNSGSKASLFFDPETVLTMCVMPVCSGKC